MQLTNKDSGNTSPAARRDDSLRARFEELAVQCDRRIYNLILRLTNDREDAADLTQETFVRAYKAFASFEGRSSEYTWLCQIAINLCRNRARDRAARPEKPLEEADFAHQGPSPHQVAATSELAERLKAAISELPEDYRVVCVLRDVGQLSYQDVAEASGLTVDVVKTRLARARGMLRRKLQGLL